MSSVDFVIITPLPEERDAILKKLEKFCTCKKGDPDQQDIQIYYSCDLPVNFPSGKQGAYKVVVMPLLGMGRSGASVATVNAIHRWHPRYVILVGIAGGNVERNIKLGDVLAPGQIVDYELQKLTSDGVEVRWQAYPTDQRLLGAVQNFTDRNAWQELIITPRSDDSLPQCYHDGSVASGDKVDAVRRVFTQYKKVWPKLLGIEMEAGGVEIATIQAAHSPGFFMIRGVSDLADEEKDSEEVKKWRLYACDVAAAYTVALLRSGPVPLQTPPDANGSIIPNKEEFLKAVSECSTMKDRHKRETLVKSLPPHIRDNITRRDATLSDVAEIVETCSEYPTGIEELVRRIEFYENGTIAMSNIRKLFEQAH
ncbi:MAG: hypothetical protein OHK0047_11450 [Leptolyngbyaceae cyanobacterium]|uniref:effector-associated domain 2-containing protein n=1 Tax=Leptodesmis sichuanensis TaxID=2906798 RepID=UPI001F1BAA79|nr:hypothetical protein [Leptodesmis sichuanensis]UIE38013.1 hypothetical protein KIK02_24450 [Leptodesmis sichuanensis A121]